MKAGLVYDQRLVLQTILFLLTLIGLQKPSVWAQVTVLPQPEIITSQQGLPQAFVPAIVQDQQGFIWMATRDGLCRYDGNHFKVFQPTIDGRPGISTSSLSGLNLDQQGRIWIFSDQNDIDVIDPLRETFTNVSRQPFFKRLFSHDIIDTHYLDRQGRLWLNFLSAKIVCIDLITHRIRQYKRQSIPGYFPTFSAFVQDKQGTMWMSNKTGLYRLDQRTDRFVQYKLADNDVRSVHIRPNGDFLLLLSRSIVVLQTQTGCTKSYPLPIYANPKTEWHHSRIVSDSQGNEYFNQYNILFRFREGKGINVLAQLDKQTAFRCLFIDRSDVLWCGTTKAGIRKYNLKVNVFKSMPYLSDFYHDLLIQNLGIPANRVPIVDKGVLPYNFRYTIDKDGKLWFNMGNNRFYRIDLLTRQITPIPFPLPLLTQYAWTDPAAPMATDPEGHVWVATDSLAMWYEAGDWRTLQYPFRAQKPSNGQSRSSSLPTVIEGQILQLVVDEQALWMITNRQGLCRMDRRTGQIRHYKYQPSDPTSLSSNQLFCLFADPLNKHILWVGTFGSGLCRFDKRTGTCRRFTTHEGLPNNVVYAAIPDQQGFLWIATNQGICRMDRRSFQTRTYTHEDGLFEDEFNRFHFLCLPDDRIILAGLGGITSFYPRQLRDDTYQPSVQITNIQVNNHSIFPSQRTDSLPVQAIYHLDLPYNQNFITVSFAGLQFNRQAKTRYRYQLVGLNKQWIETSWPVAEYTDLRSGHYTLRLNASNTSGIWSKQVRVLVLIIRPPWWASWWAILLYVGAVLGVIYGLVRYYLKHQEANQLKMIDAMKARFFTNITHEFRTPLTLILGPAEQLKQRLHNPDDQHQLDLINQHATQLLGLVNQLMQLSKAEANALRVHESQGNLVEFIKQLVHAFESQANQKGIQLIFRVENVSDYYWFDTDKLERIVSNLVANALKFTPMGGKVVVDLTASTSHKSIGASGIHLSQDSWIQLTVSDNGIGIAPDGLPYIFDRFYQVENVRVKPPVMRNYSPEPGVAEHAESPGNADQRQQEGTGIGLALVKELVEVQSGTIDVMSKVSIGTTFTVNLPYRLTTTVSASEPPIPLPTGDAQKITGKEPHIDESPVVLVVEDNVTLGNFIGASLPDFYRVHYATNGAEGWEQALDVMPDLVISDVLIPIMDGYTLCRQLKKDLRTSHIPVVLLTAKASVDSRLEGLSAGADDYIIKPFHVQELQFRVRNLLEQRRQLQQWVMTSFINPDPLPSAPTPLDPLLEKLSELVEQHLDDATFGVEELTTASGLSRMNLHRKLKALSNTSAGEFIRNYRLKRAAQLLRQGHSVSETAYLVGFEDPSYFAKSFRKVYQMTPSSFANYK